MYKLLFSSFFCFSLLNANSSKDVDKYSSISPMFTGPILAPSVATVGPGQFFIEPYLWFNDSIGYYNNHWHLHRSKEVSASIQQIIYTYFGINSYMDLILTPQFTFNYDKYEHEGYADSWRVSDFQICLDFQILKQKKDLFTPNIKFNITETLPIGSYQHLNPAKLTSDISGGGSFATNIGLVVGKKWHIYRDSFLSARTNASCSLFTPVRVHGLNAYGGDSTTSGTVHPGTTFNFLLSGEYNFLKNWALALDISNTWALKTKFNGITADSMTNTGSYILSLAPGIEYNYSENIGILGGVWFSVIGKNTPEFMNGVIILTWGGSFE